MVRLNEKGMKALEDIIYPEGANGQSVLAWALEIEEAIANRVSGESWSVELRGLRTSKGYPVFFEPTADEIDTLAE